VLLWVSSGDHGDFDTGCDGQGEVYVFSPLAGIAIFHGAEFLEEANDCVTCFYQSELLADAYT